MADDDGTRATLADRLLAAGASLVLTLPAIAILWWAGGIELALYTRGDMPGAALFAAVAAIAALAFVFPHWAPAMVGRIWGFFVWLGKLFY